MSKTGSECSPKLEVLQDSAFETNVGSKFSNDLPIDLIFPIRCSVHFFLSASLRLSYIHSKATPFDSL